MIIVKNTRGSVNINPLSYWHPHEDYNLIPGDWTNKYHADTAIREARQQEHDIEKRLETAGDNYDYLDLLSDSLSLLEECGYLPEWIARRKSCIEFFRDLWENMKGV